MTVEDSEYDFKPGQPHWQMLDDEAGLQEIDEAVESVRRAKARSETSAARPRRARKTKGSASPK